MERDPANKVVVVTGGAMGLGYEIAKYFLKNKAKIVILLDILETTGKQAAETLNKMFGEGKAIFMKCDVTKDLDAVSSEIFKKYKVDVFMNNAGILDETNFRRTIEINLIAVVEWGKKFWDHMRKDNGGSGGTIINMASIYGFEFNPWCVFYKTSKHGVVGFTKTLGHPYNYKKTGVRVFVVCPGFTDTKILQAKMGDYDIQEATEHFASQNIQKVEVVGQGVIDMFKIAETGSGWVVKEGKPIEPAPINAY